MTNIVTITQDHLRKWFIYYTDQEIAEFAAGRTEVELVELLKDPRMSDDDAIWLFCRAMAPANRRKLVEFAVQCVSPIEHLLTDERSKQALDLAQRFARGETISADTAWAERIAAAAAVAGGTCYGHARVSNEWAAAWAAAWAAEAAIAAGIRFPTAAADDAAFWAARAAEPTPATTVAARAARANQRRIAIGLISDEDPWLYEPLDAETRKIAERAGEAYIQW